MNNSVSSVSVVTCDESLLSEGSYDGQHVERALRHPERNLGKLSDALNVLKDVGGLVFAPCQTLEEFIVHGLKILKEN